MLSILLQDLRYALRQLRKSAAVSGLAVLALALGVGANTALFSVVNALLLRDLPYKDGSRLVYITEFWPHEPVVPGPPSPDFANWRAHASLVDGIAAYGGGASTLTLTGQGEPQRLQGTMVTAEFLDLVGIHLQLGRNFTRQEDALGAAGAVILSHRLWQRQFGASREVIGEPIELDGVSRTIIGVLPADFVFPDNNFRDDLLVPMGLPPDPNWRDERNFRLLRVIGRLKPGVSPAALRSELAAIAASTTSEEPPQMVTMRRGMEVRVIRLREWLSGDVRLIVLVLQAAVVMVLLIACLNVANLQIARSLARRKEMALRTALGAGLGRLVRQLLTESLLQAVFGAGAGLLIAYLGIHQLREFLPATLHLADTLRIDNAVLLFTLGIAILAGVLTGLAPALAISRADLNDTLKQTSANATQSRGQQRLHGALVIAEVAFAVVLLAASGLLIRNFLHLTALNPGFDPRGVATARVSLPMRKNFTTEGADFYTRVLEKLASIPGARSVAVGSGLPLMGTRGLAGTGFEGRPVPLGSRPSIPVAGVSTEYFSALGIPLLRGRTFTDADRDHAPLVVMVNRAFANEYFAGQNPLGKHIEVGSNNGTWREIVGITGDVQQQGRRVADRFVIYLPYRQFPESEMFLIVKSDLPSVARAIPKAVQSVDRNQAVFDSASMEQRLAESLSVQRANMTLMAVFAGLAITLAAVGIFGVLSYFVSRRSNEIGIRMTLGARPADIARLVLGQGMSLAGAGIVLGFFGAIASARPLRSLLTGVGPYDPVTLAAVLALFAGIAAAACYFPARRAARVDPMVSLRHE